ncbi:MAG: arsenate reductase (glutaredoxin) [Myxococcales bacterium]|nr:arsenate reductase (glutaredoxin) [Myxococcales bacterium]
MSIEIWHNPRCSKSRQTLALLEERGIAPSILRYLDEPPDVSRLREIAALLGGAGRLVRRKEPSFAERGLAEASEEELLEAMAEAPILIERPVVITPKGARIGRPPESVLEIL